MSIIGYAWWLAGQVAAVLAAWWPMTGILCMAVAYSVYKDGLPQDQQKRSLPWVMLMFPVIMLLWAAAAHLEPVNAAIVPWRLAVLGVIVFLHFTTSIALVMVAQNFRRQAILIAILVAWIAVVCAYQSVLALTGQHATPISIHSDVVETLPSNR